ncbi:MAG TPA: hypothetical protein VNG33_18695 [Polyangiaceae bacterium]|nr:hypothetical protein [Polyangiaceae bacterium]
MKGLWGLALSGALLLVSPVASAGCPNPCEMSVSQALVEPPLSCGTLTLNANDCACSVWFSIENDCQQNIDTSGFAWDRCFPSTDPCTSIQPGDEGIMEPRLTTTGRRDFSFVVSDAEGPHTVTFDSNVKSFNDTSCSMRAGGTSRQPISLGPLGLLALALGRRAWRRSTPAPRLFE